MSKDSIDQLLDELEAIRFRYDPPTAALRRRNLRSLARRRLPSAGDVERLHELLCFVRAYPDDSETLKLTEDLLARFPRRRDLHAHRSELFNTGIAGTDLYYRYYWVTAQWLVRHWPQQVSIDWPELDHDEELLSFLEHLLPYSETVALDTVDNSLRGWIDKLCGRDETDAAFLIRRFSALKVVPRLAEHLYEKHDLPLRLQPSADTPSRTLDRYPRAPVFLQTQPLDRARPNLKRAVRHPAESVREVSVKEGRRLIDLTRGAMVTRSRDLDAFANADARDVRIAEMGRGLQFACIGVLPERRLMLEASYGVLMLKNGMPIGYALASSLFRSSEVAYNVFETFRGGEAAWIFGRLLALICQLFGSDTLGIDPYQLGHGNDEGLQSGAWWFYYKLGFRPDNPEIEELVQRELARLRARPRYRSSLRTLETLSSDYLFLHLGRRRKGVLGKVPLGPIGLRLSKYLAEHFGADRESGLKRCAEEAVEILEVDPRRRWTRDERHWWRNWSPLVSLIPKLRDWPAADRGALAEIVLAKGGRRESEFVRRFNEHRRLQRSLLRLAREAPR